MTAAERVAVLDGTLNQGYGDFDGFILAERARAQAQGAQIGNDPGGLNSGGDAVGGDPGVSPIVIAGAPVGSTSSPGDGGGSAPAGGGAGGGGSGSSGERFPPPDDIPSGRDDDVVARQLREAATREPDPELRERLWDEYRRYTGLSR